MNQDLLAQIQAQLSQMEASAKKLVAKEKTTGLSAAEKSAVKQAGTAVKQAETVVRQKYDVQPTIPAPEIAKQTPITNGTPVPQQIPQALSDIISGTSRQDEYYQLLTQQMQADTLQREKMQQEKEGVLQKAKDFFTDRPSAAEMEQQAREQFLDRFGLPTDWEPKQMEQFMQMQSEIIDGRQKLIDLETREQEALMLAEQRLGPTTFIRGEQALIQRQYAVQKAAAGAELSAKAAVAEMYRGNIDMADRYIKDYIDLATYDLQQQKEEINWFMSYYSDEYDRLDTNIKDSINQTLRFVEKQEAEQKAELETKW